MTDWFVSSTSYAAVAVWAATTAYTVGQLIKPTAPATNRNYVFRCTTAGTSGGTEPTWSSATTDGSTIASGTATFTNVTGRSAHGWSAAAGTLACITAAQAAARAVAGDRIFVSSDHSENTNISSYSMATTEAFGCIQVISVNRAGSVPPVTADITSGATITSTASLVLEGVCDMFWQGFAFSAATGSGNSTIQFGSASYKNQYFKNCSFNMPTTFSGARYVANIGVTVIFDNTTIQFGATGQAFSTSGSPNLIWLNTPSAIQGAILPTTLFLNGSGNPSLSVTCRSVDLSAITGTLLNPVASSGWCKILLDSCKIASGLTRLGTTGTNSGDEVELVNCYDGTSVLNERYTRAGTVTTDRATYLTSGAQDDIGNYALKMAASSRSDFASMPLDCFALDVENVVVGVSKTAMVEIISSQTLNNTDIRFQLEYMGGQIIYSTWSTTDKDTGISLSNGNLTATNTNNAVCGIRAVNSKTTGKWYFEATCTVFTGTRNCVGFASGSYPLTSLGNNTSGIVGNAVLNQLGQVIVDGGTTLTIGGSGATSLNFGTIANGTVICVAVDLVAKLIWFRLGAAGNWNNAAGRDPATGTGGISIVNLGGATAAYPCGAVNNTNDVLTANFGASSFVGSIPSGFGAIGAPALDITSSIASFVDTLPNVLTPAAALPSSSGTWTTGNTFWNSGDAFAVSISANGLVATSTGSAGVRALTGYSSGKFYFEVTVNTWANGGTGLGINLASSTINGSGVAGQSIVVQSGGIFTNSVNTGSTLGTRLSGNTIGVAVDLGAQLIWFRVAPSGNWNGSGTANPATGAGGLSITSISSGALFPCFMGLQSGEQATANFGASTFSGAVPSGFVSGWPLSSGTKQKLQVAFTPQRAGRLRGLVRLGKILTTVWVDPRITVS